MFSSVDCLFVLKGTASGNVPPNSLEFNPLISSKTAPQVGTYTASEFIVGIDTNL